MNIKLENISKRYDADWIFQDINAHFLTDRTYGIVGHNGSGKSTLLQIISGFITPTSGDVVYDEGRLKVEMVFRQLSMAAPYLSLPVEMTVKEAAKYHHALKPLRAGHSVKSLLEEIELSRHKEKPLSKLSSGMRQRLTLGLAIFSDSSILLLDEPCANLDARWSNWYNETLLNHRENRLIIICSNSQDIELRNITEPVLDVSRFTP